MRSLAAFALAFLGCAGTGKPPAPRHEQVAFRIEPVFFEVPPDSAGDFHRPPDEREPTLLAGVEDPVAKAALEARSGADPRIVRRAFPALVLAAGEEGSLAGPSGLGIRLRATRVLHEWAPVRVEVGLRWAGRGGAEIAALPGSSFLLGEGRAVRLVALPPRVPSEGTPAVFGFLRVTPVFERGSAADPGPREVNR